MFGFGGILGEGGVAFWGFVERFSGGKVYACLGKLPSVVDIFFI